MVRFFFLLALAKFREGWTFGWLTMFCLSLNRPPFRWWTSYHYSRVPYATKLGQKMLRYLAWWRRAWHVLLRPRGDSRVPCKTCNGCGIYIDHPEACVGYPDQKFDHCWACHGKAFKRPPPQPKPEVHVSTGVYR